MSTETQPTAKISFVVKPAIGACPETQIRINSIRHLIPVMWEAQIKRILKKANATMVRGDYFIVITFPVNTEKDVMEDIVGRILEQATALQMLREKKTSSKKDAKVKTGSPAHRPGSRTPDNVPQALRGK